MKVPENIILQHHPSCGSAPQQKSLLWWCIQTHPQEWGRRSNDDPRTSLMLGTKVLFNNPCGLACFINVNDLHGAEATSFITIVEGGIPTPTQREKVVLIIEVAGQSLPL